MQNSIEQRYDAVQTSDQGVNKNRFFAGPDPMNTEELVGDMRAGGSLGCSDHGAVELKTLRGGSRPKSRITGLDFRRAKYTSVVVHPSIPASFSGHTVI